MTFSTHPEVVPGFEWSMPPQPDDPGWDYLGYNWIVPEQAYGTLHSQSVYVARITSVSRANRWTATIEYRGGTTDQLAQKRESVPESKFPQREVQEGDLIKFGRFHHEVRRIVPPDPERKIRGWVELDPVCSWIPEDSSTFTDCSDIPAGVLPWTKGFRLDVLKVGSEAAVSHADVIVLDMTRNNPDDNSERDELLTQNTHPCKVVFDGRVHKGDVLKFRDHSFVIRDILVDGPRRGMIMVHHDPPYLRVPRAFREPATSLKADPK
jgi:hypothetical protein